MAAAATGWESRFRAHFAALCVASVILTSVAPALATAPPASSPAAAAEAQGSNHGASVPGDLAKPAPRPDLASASSVERQTLDRMLQDASWARRAVAAVRLERYSCDPSAELLQRLLGDTAWQVRSFAVRSLARRGVPQDEAWFRTESEPRVIRAALRYRYKIDLDRVGRGVRVLARSNDLRDKMLAVEIAAASGDEELIEFACETAKTVILRMNRIEAGALSPRLSVLTGQHKMRRHFEWQQWIMKKGRAFELRPGHLLNEGERPEPALLAQVDADAFAGLESYMKEMRTRELDLAILLDCTASMGSELAAAQGGVDDMMLFVGDVVGALRVAIIGYRDHRDEFETKAWDFTPDISVARQQLWTLTADGGGDRPEAVHPALKLAFTQLHWRQPASKVLVLVGDAPPHIGLGANCVNLVERARAEGEVMTHVIQAKGKDVEHFPEIAKAGGGRCVSLEDDDALIAEITGLSLGDRFEEEFREFFRVYLELCR